MLVLYSLRWLVPRAHVVPLTRFDWSLYNRMPRDVSGRFWSEIPPHSNKGSWFLLKRKQAETKHHYIRTHAWHAFSTISRFLSFMQTSCLIHMFAEVLKTRNVTCLFIWKFKQIHVCSFYVYFEILKIVLYCFIFPTNEKCRGHAHLIESGTNTLPDRIPTTSIHKRECSAIPPKGGKAMEENEMGVI